MKKNIIVIKGDISQEQARYIVETFPKGESDWVVFLPLLSEILFGEMAKKELEVYHSELHRMLEGKDRENESSKAPNS